VVLVIGLDGYDWQYTKDIKWKDRFDYFNRLETEEHTIPSNCWVLTGQPTRLRRYIWDTADKEITIFSHRDLPRPYLWSVIHAYGYSQAWITFPLMNPLVKLPNTFVIGGLMCPKVYPETDDELIEEYRSLSEKTFHDVRKDKLLRLIDLEFAIYDSIKHDYDFIMLYVFWLDPANHQLRTRDKFEVKEAIDRHMETVELHPETLVYSDHGTVKGSWHTKEGLVGIKGTVHQITSIKQIHKWIFDVLHMG